MSAKYYEVELTVKVRVVSEDYESALSNAIADLDLADSSRIKVTSAKISLESTSLGVIPQGVS